MAGHLNGGNLGRELGEILTEQPESRWPASLALLVCGLVYLVLPEALVVGPRWLVPALIVLPLVPLTLGSRHRHAAEPRWARATTFTLMAVLSVANVSTVAVLVHRMLAGHVHDGRSLIYAAILVWLTNAVVFSLWFFELDGGGPAARSAADLRSRDFSFPQMQDPQLAPEGWMPVYFDYLYLSLTNASAFSPTDAMPITVRVKALMAVESLTSIITVVVVASRAINILN